MKKPNITKGNWEHLEDYKSVQSDLDDGTLICEIDYTGTDPEEELANAKAISAVPEMIDALIEANDYIIENAPDDIYPKELLDKLEQTLEKAGVEL